MNFQITEYCHHILEEYIGEGDICIDATAGNGGDTEFLCKKVGETGNVYAFDVQEMAIAHTKERLAKANLSARAKLIQDGHEKMQIYVKEEAKVIIFNFGYLPGGDHKIATRAATSLTAIESALNLLKKGGIYDFPSCRSDETTRDEPRYRHLRFYASQIFQFAQQGGPYAQPGVKASLELLLLALCTEFSPTLLNTMPEDEQRWAAVRRLLAYVSDHYAEKLTLENLADYAQYNRTYISTLFKQIVGINFHEYLTRVRFQHSLIDLALTTDSLTDIALRNGFADLKTFNARFRTTLQRTPAEYRAQLCPERVVGGMQRKYLPCDDPLLQRKLREYLQVGKS